MFDNSYSYFKSKKITYSVVVTTPLTEIEKGASKIEEKIFDQNDNDISQNEKDKEWMNLKAPSYSQLFKRYFNLYSIRIFDSIKIWDCFMTILKVRKYFSDLV